ncbi:hypothetical protein [Pseudoalteromonas luteoviolacea]|uniref:Uncharacterized protein n=1 Tax=Pseudoalteromonas luteoviolacea DSM 6061 TaxID=1365250 RepID=A0A167CW66_9GAMM|nr:hypothetical protein [Pseudoalteromonas luteoviolacea]KZN48135.1 hypothetical protein N475_25440 [Pseudoalteromonas luteoviolacea DSM 6061]MBE0388672.1 hypothetical protein [Pseudoalteromonas luteoviolacea DSM 6061]
MELTKEERALLVELTDFGMPLSEVITDIHFSHPKASISQKYAMVENLVIGALEKGVICLCKLTLENTKDNVYEVNNSTIMSIDEVTEHIANPLNWEQYQEQLDKSISFELAPTELGEKILDEIFAVKNGN